MIKKVQLLRILEQESEPDARQVSEALNVTAEAAGMLLLRLFRQGLVRREFDPRERVLFYSITSKGQERLEYLSHQTGSEGEGDAQKS